MPLTLDEFSELVELVYQGPLEPVPFKSALEAIRRRLRANYVTLILRPPSSDRPGLMVNASGDRPVEREADYSNYFYTLDVFVGLPTDRVVTAEEILGRRWLESEIYRQFLKPVDVLHALGADIRTADGIECRFRVSRSHAERPFGETDKALCAVLLPHLKRAVQIHAQLDVIESERKLLAGTVDRMLVGTIILDQRGAIMRANNLARELMRSGDGIREINSTIQASSSSENRELQRLIRQALNGSSDHAPAIVDAMSVTRPSGKGKLGILIRGNPLGEWSENQRRPAAVVLIRDPERKSEASVATVRRLFDLTAAEATLAILLANGLTLDHAAEQLGVRKNTARAHLRSIFSKIGVTRQTTLVRTLLSSVVWLG
ncbi:MAG TPA: LuxR C-terminal-related transcriptional regulator [Candidatus Binataceae bacterium]|nr:LuxR C-terminal-related transcriptional regulator [Candidatus Binataceae bacterium]